ncbi:MAG: Type-1 restriction enzyme MjaXIP specificity protein [Methanosaeta sp. PtaU1.Bin060]|nr:MAG: Type-1 restriction enzyme MjaXIP specificity protein [Methanosaeta sp. PtaU1.Bin060]
MADYVSLKDQRQMHITLPPLPEQRTIARILGSLDDKIELNRRMNETLEAMARAIFKSWFVDFDPVRAKAEGREPAGMDAETAALFPDSFEETELGMVPRGWKVGKISDFCSAIYSGGTPSTRDPEYWDGDIPWLSSGETRDKFIIDTERRITPAGVSNSSTRLAPAQSTVIASAGQGNTRGQTSLLTIDSYINQSVIALVANPKISSPYHLFFDLKRRYEEFRRVSDAHSSRGSLTTKLLAELNVVIPPLVIIRHFDDLLNFAIKRVTVNLHESRILATLRDALLPKLIGGEIQIK